MQLLLGGKMFSVNISSSVSNSYDLTSKHIHSDTSLISNVLVIVAIFLAASWYLRMLLKVNREHPSQPWPRRFAWFFFLGLSLIALVLIGPVASASTHDFRFHMVQHIVLMMIAAPLLILGAPVLLLMRSETSPTRTNRIRPALNSRIFRFATNPVVAWIAFASVVVGMHFTTAMDALMTLGIFGRILETCIYLGVAMLFYYTLLPGNPARNRLPPAQRVMSLFLIMIPATMTGFFLYSASIPLHTHFVVGANLLGEDPLAQQRTGGVLMWSTSMFIDVAWIAIAVSDWFDQEGIRTKRLDRLLRREAQHETQVEA